jgi:hypothetical protein
MFRHRGIRVALGLALAVISAAPFVPAAASPVCADEPRTVCGDRIFPEAERSASFIQHDNGEYEAGIKALERDYPRFVKVRRLDHYVGHKAESVEGRPIWVVEITDFQAPETNKLPVVISLSAHGPERAGLEGGARYMEDLARWAADEPQHELRNGTEKDSIGVPVSEALKKVHLYLSSINPDGWSRGDAENGGVYQRGNGAGVDLNREFPTVGWSKVSYTALSEPESKGWAEFARKIDPVVTADLHGELTSANNAFADIMLPAGQWNPLEQAQEERGARHMASNITRYFEEYGVEAGTIMGDQGMKPAEYATGYDVVGYDAAGFMGDYFTERLGAMDIDVEHFLSHLVPNSAWNGALEEAHIMSVRAEIESLMVDAIALKDVKARPQLGRAGYFRAPGVVTKKDGYGGPKPPEGVSPKGYRATRIKYFRDLSRFAARPLRAVTRRTIRGRGLRGLQTLVLADRPFGTAYKGSKGARRVAVRKISRFVRRGGNLVLTDRAVRLLGPLGVVKKGAIQKRIYTAGHINIDDFEDPYTRKVHHTASQTYYEVPLGFSVEDDSAPHWIVKAGALSKAKGKPIAHIEDETDIGLGRIRMGRGTIGFIGALLPQPTEKFDHFYGLADYGVTIAGGQILNNMIAHGR